MDNKNPVYDVERLKGLEDWLKSREDILGRWEMLISALEVNIDRERNILEYVQENFPRIKEESS